MSIRPGKQREIHISPENNNSLTYELENLNGVSFQEVISILGSGGKFIVFYYRVGYIAVSYQKLSPAILIRNKEEFELYLKRYNKMAFWRSILFFPFGPLLSFKEIKLNNKGGLNVTGDILLNLTEEDLAKNQVIMREMYTIFGKVGKSEMKYFRKILTTYGKYNSFIKEIYVATFINVEEGIEPPYCIGILTKNGAEVDFEDVEKQLYTEFRSFVEFLFFDLNNSADEDETNKRLKSQGELIYKSQ